MTADKKKQRLKQSCWIIGIICVIAILCGLIVYGHKSEEADNRRLTSAQYSAQMAKVNYKGKYTAVMKKFSQTAIHSKDPVIRNLALNTQDNTIIDAPFSNFFSVFSNWNSQKSYQQRPYKLTHVATPNVLKDKNYFGKGLDKTGGPQIQNEQLQEQMSNLELYGTSHNGSTINVIAAVQYDASSAGTSTHTGENWYLMDYNPHTNKITSMQIIGSAPNIQQTD